MWLGSFMLNTDQIKFEDSHDNEGIIRCLNGLDNVMKIEKVLNPTTPLLGAGARHWTLAYTRLG